MSGNATNAPYSSVPTAPPLSPDMSDLSPNPNDGLLNSPNAYNGPAPAPSLIGRDSTYSSLGGAATPLGNDRGSWSSGLALNGGAAAAAGAEAGAASARAAPRASRLQTSHQAEGPDDVSEKPRWAEGSGSKGKSRKWLWSALAILAILAISLGVGLGVGLTRNKSSSNTSSGSSGSGASTTDANGSTVAASKTASSTAAAPSATPTSGGMGSLITMENGETFTYDNALGGTWHWDEADPFNNDARPNSWTPKLSEEWVWGKDRMLGVNLGGWLNTEPFIVPHLYETYATGPNGTVAVDEFTLSQNMGDNLTAAMTEHYETFITERDFAAIASAGLNWIRLPVGYWALETWDDEPYLEKVSWTYVLKALKWARKYGLRVNFDLHTVPGSQNGWNHSGKIGSVNWFAGAMGLANGQRSLDYMKQIAEFINQPEYQNLILINGILNEPRGDTLGRETIGSFYLHAYEMIRNITGYGKGQAIAIFDGFLGGSSWFGFAPNADRLILDTHQYMVFQDQNTSPLEQIKNVPCQSWAVQANDTSREWGINFSGEFSNAINDCGIWVNGVNQGNRYEGSFDGYAGRGIGSCDYWNDYTQWNQSTKDAMLDVAKATMDAFQNYFFWTWKIGPSNTVSYTPNPFWSYELGLREGWIPKDPRDAIGHCASVAGVTGEPFSGTYASAWMTGGGGAGPIPATETSSFPWPLQSMRPNYNEAQLALLPQYTKTGTPIPVPQPTFTKPGSTETVDTGSVPTTGAAYTTVSGCTYPDRYNAASLGVPANACGAGIVQPTGV